MPPSNRHPVDMHVGARLRMQRRLQRMSQVRLAEGLGLTFQQVQKYESGADRISASMLFRAAEILGVPVASFFEGLGLPADLGRAEPEGPQVATLLLSNEGRDLMDIFPRLPAAMRLRVQRLVNDLVAAQDAPRDAG